MKRNYGFVQILTAFCIVVFTASVLTINPTELVSAQSNDNTTQVGDILPQAENLQSITQISLGYSHSCALTSMGAVKCWGNNSFAKLGYGNPLVTFRPTPVDVVGLNSGVPAISVGYFHTCAITDSGGVKCWGDNENGALGDGTHIDPYTLVDVIGLSSGVVAIASGGYHTCALTDTGGVKCWGFAIDGQLGSGTSPWSINTPVDVVGLTSGVAAISAGAEHTCALTSTGGVKCWGANGSGQLGDGTITNRNTPVDVEGLSSGVVAISTGGQHTCALTSTGGVKCWGGNNYGQLGDGTTTNQSAPVVVSGLTTGIVAISTGDYHTCALISVGEIECWGHNNYGQLGDGTATDRHTSVAVAGLPKGMTAISTGAEHTCALTDDGHVMCWGKNQDGQLGDGTTTNSLTPVYVVSLSLTGVNPAFLLAGSGDTEISVTGIDFNQDDVVLINSNPRQTTYVNEGLLTAILNSSDLTSMKISQISVQNLGVYESNSLPLTIYTFADAVPGTWYYRYVEGFYAKGITTGCANSPFRYCPDRAVTRAEMAVFILRSLHADALPYTPAPDPADIGVFDDVPIAGKEWMQPWIEEFYGTGMTTGCGADPLTYCPERQVTRAEMAVFVLRAIHGADYIPPAVTASSFSDVPVAGKGWMMPWIEQFYNEGLTTGCKQTPTLQYCPEQSVTRAEMATFLDRAFGFPQLP